MCQALPLLITHTRRVLYVNIQLPPACEKDKQKTPPPCEKDILRIFYNKSYKNPSSIVQNKVNIYSNTTKPRPAYSSFPNDTMVL